MRTIDLKANLHGLIDQMQDLDVLEAMYILLSKKIKAAGKEDYDFADDLPDELKNEIEKGIEEADKGELVDHESVMKKYEKWLLK